MPTSRNPAKSTTSLLEYAFNALKEHEKELDHISIHLKKVKEQVSIGLGKTNADLENLAQKIESLNNEIYELNQFIN